MENPEKKCGCGCGCDCGKKKKGKMQYVIMIATGIVLLASTIQAIRYLRKSV